MAETITAATDGSALGNPGPGGWAWWVSPGAYRAGGTHEITTNQRMELVALGELLKAYPESHLEIHLDSQYAMSCLTSWRHNWERNGWVNSQGKAVSNQDVIRPLCQQLDEREIRGLCIRMTWVKGHSAHQGNIEADKLARKAAREAKRLQRNISISPGI